MHSAIRVSRVRLHRVGIADDSAINISAKQRPTLHAKAATAIALFSISVSQLLGSMSSTTLHLPCGGLRT